MRRWKIKMQTIKSHFLEFKGRLIKCVLCFILAFVFVFTYAQDIYNWLALPLVAVNPEINMIYTALGEGFVTYLKIASYGATLVSFPYWLWHVYRFISPGLYKHEKSVLIPCFILSPLFFVAGVLLLYYLAMPLIWQFFLSFETNSHEYVPIVLQAKISEYLSLFLELSLAFGLSFQLPILVLVLVALGVIDIKFLQQKRKYAIVLSFIVAAILTPPDVISQITLAIPLVLLYEISVILATILRRRKV